MNKLFLIMLFLVVTPKLYAEGDEMESLETLEASSEVVDPMSPVTPEETSAAEAPVAEAPAPAVAEPEVIKEAATAEAVLSEDEFIEDPAAASAATEVAPAEVEAAPEVAEPEAVPESESAPAKEVATHEFTPTPTLASEIKLEPSDDFVPRASHWLSTFGFEGLEYEVPLEFTGLKDRFQDEKRTLYGGRLGFGREFYLGWGFNTTTKIEGYFSGTLFEKAINAAPEQNGEVVAFTKRTGQIYGVDIVQTIGRLFDFHTKNPFMEEMTYLTLEPFVEAGIGQARAYNRLNYHYSTTINEDYRVRVQDSISSTRLGAGFNLTSGAGYFLYVKATQYIFNVTKREEQRFSQQNLGAPEKSSVTSTDVDMDPVTIYSLGGGYKF